MLRAKPVRKEGVIAMSAWRISFASALLALASATAVYGRPIRSPELEFSPIQHVIIIVQENRSTDNLFHGLPGADTVDSGLDSHGRAITLKAVSLTANYGMGHSHHDFLVSYAGGAMNGFDLESEGCSGRSCVEDGAYGYVPQSQVQPYFDMAEQYTFGDRMFQTNQGPSYPAHQFLLAGTSEPSVGSDLLAAENPISSDNATEGGCDAAAGTFVQLITPAGDEHTHMFPCFDHPTLTDLLDGAGLSWRYYAPSPDSIWTAPSSIHHIRYGNDWQNVVIPQTAVLTDIQNGNLASVSWVIPDGLDSDHANETDGSGPSWVASIVNAVGNSPFWFNTAIVITWDDWGGWYDHVKPSNIYNSYELGFRVPLVVVSPYARMGYVSHVNHQFGSILHFVEDNFNLGTLGFADSQSDDLSDCFNFEQVPMPFRTIDAPVGPRWFLRRGAPHPPPDDY